MQTAKLFNRGQTVEKKDNGKKIFPDYFLNCRLSKNIDVFVYQGVYLLKVLQFKNI